MSDESGFEFLALVISRVVPFWTYHMISLNLSFFISKMGTLMRHHFIKLLGQENEVMIVKP